MQGACARESSASGQHAAALMLRGGNQARVSAAQQHCWLSMPGHLYTTQHPQQLTRVLWKRVCVAEREAAASGCGKAANTPLASTAGHSLHSLTPPTLPSVARCTHSPRPSCWEDGGRAAAAGAAGAGGAGRAAGGGRRRRRGGRRTCAGAPTASDSTQSVIRATRASGGGMAAVQRVVGAPSPAADARAACRAQYEEIIVNRVWKLHDQCARRPLLGPAACRRRAVPAAPRAKGTLALRMQQLAESCRDSGCCKPAVASSGWHGVRTGPSCVPPRWRRLRRSAALGRSHNNLLASRRLTPTRVPVHLGLGAQCCKPAPLRLCCCRPSVPRRELAAAACSCMRLGAQSSTTCGECGIVSTLCQPHMQAL